jgi:hypothetical protein
MWTSSEYKEEVLPLEITCLVSAELKINEKCNFVDGTDTSSFGQCCFFIRALDVMT